MKSLFNHQVWGASVVSALYATFTLAFTVPVWAIDPEEDASGPSIEQQEMESSEGKTLSLEPISLKDAIDDSEKSIIEARQAIKLYDEVWKLINMRSLYQDKNGQDWLIWRHRYDDVLKNQDDANVAIRSMLISLNDIYTRYLDPEEFAEEGRSIKALLFGIGIQIGVQNDRIVVIAPIEDTPAQKAGIGSGDVVLEIDGKSTQGMDTKDAADMIRGEKGTKVKLLVKQGTKQPKLFEIVRDEIKLKSVSTKASIPVNPELGYIRLSSFLSETASAELEKALDEQKDKKGYIIDLRSNPGGLLKNAIQLADDFLDSGAAIVSTVDKDGYKETVTTTPGVLTDKPIVLLINEGSASASEILSGALRDNNRTALVGKKTFGKGLVQEINALPLGAGINITTQKYLTPNDTDINKKGILPDIEVAPVELKDDEKYDAVKHGDPQLKVGEQVLTQLIAGKSLSVIQMDYQAKTQPKAVTTAKATLQPSAQIPIKVPLQIR